MTTRDNEWQHMTTDDTMSDSKWQQAVQQIRVFEGK